MLKKTVYTIALMRPRTCFLGVFIYLLGVRTAGIDWGAPQTFCLIGCFLVSTIANLHNALTDLEEDSRYLGGRAKAIEVIGKRTVLLTVSITCLITFVFMALSGLYNVFIAIAVIFIAIAYSQQPFRFKTHTLLGLLVFASVGFFLYFSGLLFSYSWMKVSLFDHPLRTYLLGIYLFLVLCGKFTIKNLPDYYSDRAAGLKTSATVFSTIEQAKLVSVIFSQIVYFIPFFLQFLSLPWSNWALWWIPFAVINVSLFYLEKTEVELNRRMKWDMLSSAIFFAAMSFPETWMNGYCVAWIASVCTLTLSMVIPIDSRLGLFLTTTDSKHPPNDRGKNA